LFKNTLKTLQKHPFLGKKTEDSEVRFILAKLYLIYYIETNESFVVVHILDGIRNPDEGKFQRKNKEVFFKISIVSSQLARVFSLAFVSNK